jgi:hypothetical protein
MLLVPLLAAVTLSLSDSSDANLRSVPESDATSLDIGTTPSVGLAITSKRSTFDIGYQPNLAWIDVTRERDFAIQHSAGMGYTWSTRRLKLNLTLGGSYGRVSYLSAVAAVTPTAMQPAGAGLDPGAAPNPAQPGQMPEMQAATPQLLPRVSVLEVASAGIGLNASFMMSRRWSVSLGSGFSLGGGIGDSEDYLPFRYGPYANAAVAYQVAKFDTLSTALLGSLDILPEQRGRFYTITLLETWTHAFNTLASSTLGAGATYVQARASPGAERERAVNAAGLASITKGFKLQGGALFGVTASSTLSTTYNPVLGEVAHSLSGGVDSSWTRKRLTLSLGVQGSRSLPFDDPEAFTSYGASAGANYQLTDLVSLRAGVYWTRQILPDAPALAAADPNSWGASLGITVAAPPIKL